MSEELLDTKIEIPEEGNVDVEKNTPPQEPAEPSVEDLARARGWKPKEEYNGEVGRWKSAEVFMALEEPIQKIEALARELKETKRANQMLMSHHLQVKDSEFKRAVEFLKQQKKAAFEAGDVDKILEVDEQIELVKDTQRQQRQAFQERPQPDNTGELHPDYLRWVEQNTWYNSDKDMREMADAIGLTYAQRNPNKTPVEVLDHVATQIKTKIFKDKFENPNRQKQTVESPTRSGSRTDTFEMSDEEKQVMNTFVKQGIMSKEDYTKELKVMRGIK
jgi:hypothetical protein